MTNNQSNTPPRAQYVHTQNGACAYEDAHPHKARIEYIDALRGFTMILVVLGHVVSLLFDTESSLTNFFKIFRMPLFFFISGFFSYSCYDKELMLKRIKNRILLQFMPTIITLSAFLLLFNLPFNAFFQAQKSGFWFTIVVVEFFLTYMLVLSISQPFIHGKNKQAAIIVLLIVLSRIVLMTLSRGGVLSNDVEGIFGLLSIPNYLNYFMFFFMGVLAKMYWTQFCALISNQWFMSGLFVIGTTIFIRYGMSGVLSYVILRAVLLIIVFRLFSKYQDIFSSGTKLGRSLCYIGKNTLEIYFIHYFIIQSLLPLRDIVNTTIIDASWLTQMLVYLPVTMIIVGGCLFISNSFKIMPPIYNLFFGKI